MRSLYPIYSLAKYPQTRPNVGSAALGTFKVRFRVSNPAATPCAIGVWTCGYCLQWGTDNTNVYVEVWGCDSNWPYGVFLDSTYIAKDVYEGELPIMVRTNTKLGNISFRMCFIPEKKEKCNDNPSNTLTNWAEGKYWSNPVTITVVP